MEILTQNITRNYELKIGGDLKIDASNFEELLDKKHENLKSKFIEEFLQENREVRKPYKNNLENVIQNIFNSFRTRKVREHKNFIETQQRILNMKIESRVEQLLTEYKNLMELNVDYERENFEFWLNDRHASVKNQIKKQFNEISDVEKCLKADEFRNNLNSRIESSYNVIKPLKLEKYRKEKEKRIQQFLTQKIADQLQAYKDEFLKDIKYGREDFEAYINRINQLSKDTAIRKFESTLKPEHDSEKSSFKTKLTKSIDSFFTSWKSSAFNSNSNHLIIKNDEMKSIANSLLRAYKKKLTNEISTTSNFVSTDTLLDEFRTSVSYMNCPAAQKRLETYLSNEIEEHIEDTLKTWKTGDSSKYTNYKLIVTFYDYKKSMDGLFITGSTLTEYEILNKYDNYMEEALKNLANFTLGFSYFFKSIELTSLIEEYAKKFLKKYRGD